MTDEELREYVRQLASADAENAYYLLLTHSTEENISALIDAYHQQHNPQIQAQLIEILWRQHPSVTPLEFLAQALQNLIPEVWKAALDGFVAIGKSDCLVVLERERQRLLASQSQDALKRLEWVDEAIQQLSKDG